MNLSTESVKEMTRAMSYNLQDDVLALHLQMFVERVVRVLLYAYVAGVMATEVVQTYLTLLVDWMSPKIP